jgi:hypothetical protein
LPFFVAARVFANASPSLRFLDKRGSCGRPSWPKLARFCSLALAV